jgi:hypothetical protein
MIFFSHNNLLFGLLLLTCCRTALLRWQERQRPPGILWNFQFFEDRNNGL